MQIDESHRRPERLNRENDGDSSRPSCDLCYHLSMLNFGKGPVLKDACPWLQDDAERHRRILEVTERDSVIEGLPPFHDETRRRIAEQLMAIDRTLPFRVPAE
jgi:hypothetical protein